MSKPEHTHHSVSQLKTYKECNRKWGWVYLNGKPRSSSKAAEDGKRLHDVLENYLKGEPLGATKDEAKIIAPGLKHLPDPGTVETELEFRLLLDGLELPILGYIDFLDPHGALVGDHKTVGSFNYMLTEDDLKTDIQANVYAKQHMSSSGLDAAYCRWVYYRRTPRKPEARSIEVKLTEKEVDKNLQDMLPILQEMEEHRFGGAQAEGLRANYDACGNYGGCPHIKDCEAADRKPMNKKLLDKMKQIKEKKTPGVNPPEEAIAEKPEKTVAKKKATKKKPPSGGLTLLLGCAPLKGEGSILFSDYVQPVLDAIEAEEGSHYKLIPNLFGGNAAVLQNALAEYLEENPPTGLMIVTPSPVYTDVAQVMEAHATTVIGRA